MNTFLPKDTTLNEYHIIAIVYLTMETDKTSLARCMCVCVN